VVVAPAASSLAALTRRRRALKRATSSPKTRVGGPRRNASGRTWNARAPRRGIAPGCAAYGYESASGRRLFLNRDPIEEAGGLNLYGFCGNDGVNGWDYLGMSWWSDIKSFMDDVSNAINHAINSFLGREPEGEYADEMVVLDRFEVTESRGKGSSSEGNPVFNVIAERVLQEAVNDVNRDREREYTASELPHELTETMWFKPDDHAYTVGRENHWLVSPGSLIGRSIEHLVPAGHVFGANHDAYVDYATKQLGHSDLRANIPSMPRIYYQSVYQQLRNSPVALTNALFDTQFPVPYPHFPSKAEALPTQTLTNEEK